MASVSHRDALQKVVQYRAFYHETLKPDLDQAVEQRAKLIDEVGEYQELRESISLQQQQQQDKGLSDHHVSSKRMINLGSDVYGTAKVQDPKTIYISVGLGFYLQCSLDEGLGLVTERIEILQRKKVGLDHSISHIKADIDLVLEGIQELKRVSEQDQAKT